MKTITIVTSNPGKLQEWQRLFPKDYKLESAALDLIEIQHLDPVVVAKDKAKRAYKKLGKPVLVDDVSAGLDELKGLPGTFMKYFEEALGSDALFRLAGNKSAACSVTAVAAYYDGERSLHGVGTVRGKVLDPKGKKGWGFDFVFMPDGHTETYAQMGPERKDKISHRSLAIQDLVRQLNDL